MKVLFAGLFLLGMVEVTHAECHFDTPNTIVCLNAKPAATAFANYGFDIAKTNLSYNRELLRQSGCARVYGPKFSEHKIVLANKGRIATPTGWVGVSIVIVNGHDIYYVASKYISGACPVNNSPGKFVDPNGPVPNQGNN
jgi:hypothetical protein